MPEDKLPLSDVTVIDLTRVRSGPTAVRQLADWGADAIRIEDPSLGESGDGMGGPREGPDFQNLQRNKRAMTINLKAEEGLAIFRKLVAKADVVVENYRPDVKFRLGIDYESVRQVNPRIIYGSISGFGQDGPYRDRPGFDQVAQGIGGLMSITGLPGQGPVRAGIPVADLTAGLFLAQGILIALYERERTGLGQWVHTSLIESQIAMLDLQAARWLIGHEVPQQAGNDHPTQIPTGVFQTANGYINIAASANALFARLCDAIGAPELAKHPDFAEGPLRSTNRVALNAAIAERTRTRPTAEWIEKLNAAGVACGAINSIDEVFADEQVQHLGMTRKVDSQYGELEVVAQPLNLSSHGINGRPEVRKAAPGPGENTDEILDSLGYDAATIARLREQGVI